MILKEHLACIDFEYAIDKIDVLKDSYDLL